MPEKVTQSKSKFNKEMAIFSIVFTLIPVIIVMLTGMKNLKSPYGIYALFALGISVYFSIIIAFIAVKNKFLYIFFDVINLVCSVGFLIYSYINSSYKGGLLLHLSASLMLIYSLYRSGDSEQSDNYFLRWLPQAGYIIGGLVFVLWFISVKMPIGVHIVIVSIINFFSIVMYLIPSFVTTLKKGSAFYSNIDADEFEYQDETEEEKEKRIQEKNEKREAARALKEETSRAKASEKVNYNEPSVSSNPGADDYGFPPGYIPEWVIDPDELDRIEKTAREQYNNVVDWINADIRRNNRELEDKYRTPTSTEIAVKGNKFADNAYKKYTKYYKKLKANIKKLRKMVFTTNDCYKHFKYDIHKGKLTFKKQEKPAPTLFMIGCNFDVIFAATAFKWGTAYGNIEIKSEKLTLLSKDEYARYFKK